MRRGDVHDADRVAAIGHPRRCRLPHARPRRGRRRRTLSSACTPRQAARSKSQGAAQKTEAPAPAPAREKFLRRFEHEVAPYERRRRVQHAKRAYMLRLSKRGMAARKAAG
jgi:hypothetical protein